MVDTILEIHQLDQFLAHIQDESSVLWNKSQSLSSRKREYEIERVGHGPMTTSELLETSLMDDVADEAFLISLERSRINHNLDYSRKMLVIASDDNSHQSSPASNRIASITTALSHIKEVSYPILEHEKQTYEELRELKEKIIYEKEQIAGKHLSPSFNLEEDGDEDFTGAKSQIPADVTYNHNPSEAVSTFHDKMAQDQTEQDQLAASVLAMTQRLKENAKKLNVLIEEDSDILKTTSNSLNKVVGSLDKVSSRLDKYYNITSLGWWFYIWAFLGIFLALVVGMVLIRLFPKF
ncbi:hypothetical protein NADFUDRAFT_81743 [Nadsonia fulvescens var. elongata DSM 6958]|uniref:t-SNARE coiled-coil homology domain-containing protein n=1 Tax=Nadsonia fulvescens var. elongata DSM 6958 TaxID=857566 RepID=A0A1E3PP21_9ASCO|nr:hypothetical protein NADFUDRAFT_81743 [Nadsonia fulvescens var. elongata DSM 6958]